MNRLDDIKLVKKLDSSGMLDRIAGLPEQCKEAYEIGKKADIKKPDRKINNIVFAGLGGSAIGADIVRVYLQDVLKLAVVVNRNYTLPNFVGGDTLLFCSSYSGNTEETLSSFHDGLKRGAYIITLGSGGKLKEESLKNSFTHITIPSGFPPRTAVGYMSLPLFSVLSKLGYIKDKEKEVTEVSCALNDLRDKELGIEVTCENNIAKKIATALYGRFCIIYGTSDTTSPVSFRWRTQIAENAKALSSHHSFPEMNHNEIVGWEFPKDLLKDFKVVILRDRGDYDRTKKRIEITKKIIEESGAEIFELEGKKGSLLARLFSLIYIGDFVSFYLSLLNGIDPTPVKRVDYLKGQLAKL